MHDSHMSADKYWATGHITGGKRGGGEAGGGLGGGPPGGRGGEGDGGLPGGGGEGGGGEGGGGEGAVAAAVCAPSRSHSSTAVLSCDNLPVPVVRNTCQQSSGRAWMRGIGVSGLSCSHAKGAHLSAALSGLPLQVMP